MTVLAARHGNDLHAGLSISTQAIFGGIVANQQAAAMLARAGAANLLLVTLLIPPFAIALEGVFLGEQITTAAWIGFAIIAFGSAANDGRAAQYLLARMKTGRPNS